MIYKEKTTSSKVIFEGRVIKVIYDDVFIEETNVKSIREVVIHNGGACALVKTKNNKFLFVKQYRYPFKEVLLEVPAGKIETGESPDTTIIREAQEEVGVYPNSIHYLGKIYSSPGFCSEVIHLYYIDDYTLCEKHFDEDESLDVYEYSLEEVLELINQGMIVDAKTLCIILLMKDKLQKENM